MAQVFELIFFLLVSKFFKYKGLLLPRSYREKLRHFNFYFLQEVQFCFWTESKYQTWVVLLRILEKDAISILMLTYSLMSSMSQFLRISLKSFLLWILTLYLLSKMISQIHFNRQSLRILLLSSKNLSNLLRLLLMILPNTYLELASHLSFPDLHN